MRLPFSAGALGSSVHDLLTWLQAFHGRRVVSDDSYRQMTTPGTLNNGEAIGYGFGLAVGDFEDHRVISHGDGSNGLRHIRPTIRMTTSRSWSSTTHRPTPGGSSAASRV